MEIQTDTPEQLALDRAVEIAGGKTALMRKLNERGWDVGSHNTITQWRVSGVPAKYCPDIEDLTGVRCEDFCPGPNWDVIRQNSIKPAPTFTRANGDVVTDQRKPDIVAKAV